MNISVKKSLLETIKSFESKVTDAHETNINLVKKIELQEKEVLESLSKKKENDTKLKLHIKEHTDYMVETDTKIKALNKTIKAKEKEIHNLTRDHKNRLDTISNLKADTSELKTRESKLKGEIKGLERRLKKFDSKTKQQLLRLWK